MKEEDEADTAEEAKDQDEGGKWKQATARRRRARDPDAMINDTTDRPAAAKRAGEDLGAEEARQEEEREKKKKDAQTESPAQSDESKKK